MKKIGAVKKLDAVREVLEGGKSISKVAKKYNCSRQSIHLWIQSYKKNPVLGVGNFKANYKSGKKHPKSVGWKIERRVLDLAVEKPGLSIRAIEAELAKGGIKVSAHGIHNILLRLNLNDKNKRHDFSLKHPLKMLFATAMPPAYRAKVVEEYLEGKKPILGICKAWKISRPTFYEWLTRYKVAQKLEGESSDLLYALSRHYKKGYENHRSVGEKGRDIVLDLVRKKPEYSVHRLYDVVSRIEGKPVVGHHGIQNILKREDLNTYAKRAVFAGGYIGEKIKVAPLYQPQMPMYKLRQILAPFATIPKLSWLLTRGQILFVAVLLGGFYLYEVFWAVITSNTGTPIGIFLAAISLTFGIFFFVYSMKYYISTLLVLRLAQSGGNARKTLFNIPFINRPISLGKKQEGVSPLSLNLERVKLLEKPFVSIHVAIYNERRVIERLIKAISGQDYPNYEVIIADDSTDTTTGLAKELLASDGRTFARTFGEDDLEIFTSTAAGKPTVKLIHRQTRSGFKGAALQKALENTDPRAEYITIFDADFVPFADTLEQFMKSFQEICGGLEKVKESKIAAVQGYQWHVLNKSQTWVTRGVRTEYSGSYVIERSGEQIYGGLRQIAGSVYCIRADVLRQFGWGTSITEDFELTLRLYEQGYKVAFTPYIQAPAEAVSTLKRLVRQRMRWAEGASYNIKMMIPRIIASTNMTMPEKLEFAYLGPYYLQAAFFVVGTLSWFVSEAILGSHLPFWTAALGWSLVFTNIFALPLMNVIGMFLEESDERDYAGIVSFVALSYIVVPFQAYAAIKGFLESSEGPWFRTPKTGAITDVFGRPGFTKFFGSLLGGQKIAGGATSASVSRQLDPAYLGTSAFNWFGDRLAVVPNLVPRSPGKLKWYGRVVLVFLILFSVNLFYFSRGVPVVEATNMGGPLKLDLGQPDQTGPAWSNQLDNSQLYGSSSTLIPLGNTYANTNSSSNKYFWLTNFLPTGGPNAVIPGGNYYVQFAKQGNGTVPTGTSTNDWIQLFLTAQDGTGATLIASNSLQMGQANADNVLMQFYIGNIVGNQITNAAQNRFAFLITYDNGSTGSPNCRTNTNCYWNMAINNTNIPARLIIPAAGITVPEIPKPVVLAILLVVMPVLPMIVSGRYRKKGRNVVEELGMAWKDLIRKLLGTDVTLDELPV